MRLATRRDARSRGSESANPAGPGAATGRGFRVPEYAAKPEAAERSERSCRAGLHGPLGAVCPRPRPARPPPAGSLKIQRHVRGKRPKVGVRHPRAGAGGGEPIHRRDPASKPSVLSALSAAACLVGPGQRASGPSRAGAARRCRLPRCRHAEMPTQISGRGAAWVLPAPSHPLHKLQN